MLKLLLSSLTLTPPLFFVESALVVVAVVVAIVVGFAVVVVVSAVATIHSLTVDKLFTFWGLWSAFVPFARSFAAGLSAVCMGESK